MRVVERLPNTESQLYRVTKGVGIASGILSLIICILLISNNLRVKSLDPIHLPALERLLKELEKNPNDQALREEIRELDLLARKAFFTSQEFNRKGIWIMLGSLAIMVLCFKFTAKTHQFIAYPEGRDPSDTMIKDAQWTRMAVAGIGLFLFGFALILALTSESQLDKRMAAIDNPEPEIETKTADAAPAAKPITVPTREEYFKNWPGFRGVDGQGIAGATESMPPLEWNGEDGTNIVWKVPISKPGFGSPVIWGNKIFVSGGDDDAREVYCFNADDGSTLWSHTISGIEGSPAEAPKVAGDTGHAAASPATNGTYFYAIFSTGDLVAYDMEGNLAWGKNLGVPDNHYGHSSSLIVYEDMLIVQFDHKGSGHLYGLEASTGDVRWEAKRTEDITWSSPIIVNTGERDEIILTNNPNVTAHDPKTGAELWRHEVLGGEVAPSPAYADGLVYVASDYVKLAAIDVKTQARVWENEQDIPGVSSPLVTGGLLFYGLSDGGIICRDAKTGEEVWFEETDYGFYASPILVGDRVYMMDRDGVMHIFSASREYKTLGMPVLGEGAVCTPALLNGHIIYRGVKNLYRIGT